MGGAVIVGRKTLEDFPNGAPLDGRYNIVMSKQDISIPNAVVAKNMATAVVLSRKFENCFVIGGASVFEQFFCFIDEVYVTKIDACPVSDSFFPNLDEDYRWECVENEIPKVYNGVSYQFLKYVRKV